MNNVDKDNEKVKTWYNLNLQLAQYHMHQNDFKLAISQLKKVRRSLEKLYSNQL